MTTTLLAPPTAPVLTDGAAFCWEVRLFGGLSARYGNAHRVSRFRTQKVGALLAYLALFPQRSHPREELAALFWPDAGPEAARASLRNALAVLRRELEGPGLGPAGGVLLADGHASVRLHPDAVRTDVARFEAARSRAADAPDPLPHLEEAVALYGGPLLPDFADPWAAGERERLQAAYQDAARRLSALYAGTGHARRGPNFAVGTGATPSPRGPVRLPLTPTRFFGREAELSRLDGLLVPAAGGGGGARLVTLTGAGGSGKTRLSIEAARQAAARFPGGVHFVPLADLREPGAIPAAVALALGMERRPGTPDPDAAAVAHEIAGRPGGPVLLVLDNAEHLLAPDGSDADADAAAFALDLLHRAPNLTLLVTSRHALGLEGEREVSVGPLPAPGREAGGADANADAAPEDLLRFAAVQMFVQRAQAVQPDFPYNARNAGCVARLCALLEGVPLALELAAPLLRQFSCAQLVERLAASPQIDALPTRRRTSDPRHASLRAAIEWGYDLLPDPALRRCLARLSVFRGGWTLGAAERVLGGDSGVGYSVLGSEASPNTQHPTPAFTLDALQELAARSLIVAEPGGSDGDGAEMRYRMLESLREFADEKLTGEERAEARRRHVAALLALAEEAAPHLDGPEAARWCARLEAERDNLRAALDYSLEAARSGGPGDAEPGLRLGASLTLYWFQHGRWDEGRGRLASLIEAAEAAGTAAPDSPALLDALPAYAQFINADADPDRAAQVYVRAAEGSRRRGDRRRLARALVGCSYALSRGGEAKAARAAAAEALPLCRESGDRGLLCTALVESGWRECEAGDLAAGLALLREALALSREGAREGDVPSDQTCWSLYALGHWHLQAADFDAALSYLAANVEGRRRQGVEWIVANGLRTLGEARLAAGDAAGAGRAFGEARALTDSNGEHGATAEAVLGLALTAEAAGNPREAAAHLGSALAVLRSGNNAPVLCRALDAAARFAADGQDAARAHDLAAEALRVRRSRRDPRGVPASAVAFASVSVRTGDAVTAARLLGAAEVLREAVGVPWSPLERREAERHAGSAARAALGSSGYEAARADGAARPHVALVAALPPV